MDQKDNTILKLTIEFSIEVISFVEKLEEKRKFVVANQLLKSGTSIGANVHEAQNAESKSDFIHKLKIAHKEADETMYWLELLKETNYISDLEFNSLHEQSTEVLKIIRSIIITSKKNL